jgi:branched-chain amino acid transport system ATP-binding protein
MSALLEISHLTKSFAGVTAVQDVSISLEPGEIVGLIGPNGAGKTTLVNLVTGVLKPDAGHITFDTQVLSGLPGYRIAQTGVARTFQVVQPFPDFTVLQNVSTAALFARRLNDLAEADRIALECLEFTGLAASAHKLAATLNLASRKRLELAKSLATDPRLLLLDEVNAGLNPREIDGAIELINAIAAKGVTIVLIEHLMKVVTRICRRIVVLHHGRLIADGPVETVLHDEEVVQAYLGKRYAAMIAAQP